MSKESTERRSFLSHVNVGAASVAALAIGSAALAQDKPAGSAKWEPTRHDKDNWMDRPAKHRLILDTTTANGFGEALAFATNYVNVNRAEYGVGENDLALIVIARHMSTPYGYNDAMWEKYGAALAPLVKFDDPKTKQPAKTNVFGASDYGNLLPSRGSTVSSLAKMGVQFGVCSVATRGLSGLLAQSVGAKADDVNAELIANLIGNARMVPAGIVAVSRAQERGYTLVTA